MIDIEKVVSAINYNGNPLELAGGGAVEYDITPVSYLPLSIPVACDTTKDYTVAFISNITPELAAAQTISAGQQMFSFGSCTKCSAVGLAAGNGNTVKKTFGKDSGFGLSVSRSADGLRISYASNAVVMAIGVTYKVIYHEWSDFDD